LRTCSCRRCRRWAQAKLLRRQQSLTPQQRQDERAGLAGRAVAVSRGNPGLQDLIGLRLVYGDRVPAERAEAAVTGMEDYLQRGAHPAEPEVRAFLENLALDALLAEAGPASTELLRAATLFTLPVPEPVIDALAGAADGSPGRLRGLGLLDPYPDPVDPDRTALAASPLAAGRLDPLTSAEQAALAAVATGPLFAAWGGPASQPWRDRSLDLQLTRLALLADDPAVIAACAADAVAALRDGPAAAAFELGRDAIALLDRHSRSVPLHLLRRAADAALTSGDGEAGEALLTRAARQAESGDEDPSPLDKARVLTEQAVHLITRGDPGKAEELLRHACQLFTDAGSEAEAAAAMGSIADIAYDRGDYDEALRIRREVELPVYERLGKTRSTAVTWGKIADIAYQRGDHDEALRIHRVIELPVYERLGDSRETAISWGKIADIAYQRGDHDEALRIHREITLPVYERLGETPSTAVIWGKIADIAYQRGDHDVAAELQGKRLEVHKQLGDLDGIASANWGLARIDLSRQEYLAAIARLIESFAINIQLQRPDGIAVVGSRLGELLLAAGQGDQGRQVLEAAMTAAAKIGWTDMARQISQLLQPQPQDQEP
jgi:tetratricopeptide (TPR) repeat protein